MPRFFLYGEAETKADEHFIHAETLERRSQPSGWQIQPHAHADLNHVFVIGSGGGALLAGGERQAFTAPCLLLIPAGEVHGFDWDAESQGHVVTFVDPLLRGLARREPGLAELFDRPAALQLGEDGADCLRLAGLLEAEMSGGRVGKALLVEAALMALLVHAWRSARLSVGGGAAARGPRAALVARYRDLIEAHYREGWGVAQFADALGVTAGRLRAACMAVTGHPPIDLLHERLLAEAKRSLLYSDLGVAEVAFELGFGDPAYFNRFFTSRVGCSPGRFRQGAAG
ncbi:helix-turn-helix domain-containing protein [Niveispirillum sp. KHB5.9]|uniref:helix-turn-helix domain-containing protein n=1 Tax=Niveispirillum sp. KHB5.9 TaxID=3400269 RepID=UPI003A8B03D4